MARMTINKRLCLMLCVLSSILITILTLVAQHPYEWLVYRLQLGVCNSMSTMKVRNAWPDSDSLMDHTYRNRASPSTRNTANTRNYNLTVVSAFFNLGNFQKVDDVYFTTDLYREWASVLCRLHNPLVFYTDMPELKKLFEDCRENLASITKVIIIVNRTSLWSFRLKQQIKGIFENPNYSSPIYPKQQSNAILPDYLCIQHAKYELVVNTIKNRIFNANHFAWLDVGYFRDIVDCNGEFILETPSELRDSKIAYTRVQNSPMNLAPPTIFHENVVWVGGGMFIGRPNTLLKYAEQYKRAVQTFLDEKLINSDQQVVYSMFTDIGRKKIRPEIEPQLYVPRGSGNPWFYLGYSCLRKLLR